MLTEMNEVLSRQFECVWKFSTTTTLHPATYSILSAVIVHNVFLFGFAFMYGAFDYIPVMHRYKLQKGKFSTIGQQLMAAKQIMLNNFIVYTPSIIPLTLFPDYIDVVDSRYETIPPLPNVAVSVFLGMVIMDAYFYFLHRAMHHPLLYKHVHKLHHEFTAPVAITAEYVSSLEALLYLPGIMVAITPCGHAFSLWMYNIVEAFKGTTSHSDYEIWWLNPLNI